MDVGQSDVEGLSDGWLLGNALDDGDSDGVDVGRPEILGPWLGIELGSTVGISDGRPEMLGSKLGVDVGQADG